MAKAKKEPKQRACPCGKDITHLPGGTSYCSACCGARGICTSCFYNPQDVPGFRTCSRCQDYQLKRRDRQEIEYGRRGILVGWQMRQIKRDKEFGDQLVEKFKKDLANANG